MWVELRSPSHIQMSCIMMLVKFVLETHFGIHIIESHLSFNGFPFLGITV